MSMSQHSDVTASSKMKLPTDHNDRISWSHCANTDSVGDTHMHFTSDLQSDNNKLINGCMYQETRQLAQSSVYNPTDYDVVCGRGKGYYDKPGNKKFRSIVATEVDNYISATTKTAKSIILDNIVQRVEEQNNGNATFLKYNGKKKGWCKMSHFEAREKVGHAIREAIIVKENIPMKEASKTQFMKKHIELLKSQQSIFHELLSRLQISNDDS
jgi:hypothetical protein